MERREFLKAVAILVAGATPGCGSENGVPTSPSNIPSPTVPRSASANPVVPKLAGQFVTRFKSPKTTTLYFALSDAGFNPNAPQTSYEENGVKKIGPLIRSLILNGNFETPANGFDFMVNNGHYFVGVDALIVVKDEPIDIYIPPPWDGVSQ